MSSEAVHTPGPWELRVYEWGYVIAAPQEGCQIEQTPFDENVLTNRRQLADARLKTAAPELLEAAKAAGQVIGALEDMQGFGAYLQLREAIAKAEGR